MIEDVAKVLAQDGRIAYALLFGSAARGRTHAQSDVDVAVGLAPGVALTAAEFGGVVADLEQATRRTVDLVILNEAPAPLAFRIFRDGQVILQTDRAALVERKARAILEYLDWKPIEDLFTRGVLAAATRGR